MKEAYKSSGQIFEQVSKLRSPALYQQLKAITPGELVVVQGQYDHIEALLDTLHVPYELITPEQMKSHNGGRVWFVNCKPYDGGVPKKAVEQFVQEGGRLVTTDWAQGLVAKVFPGRVKKVVDTSDDVVEVQCHTDIARRFLGLNYSQCHPKWWLEGSSHVFDIGEGVVPLITSTEMEEKYGKPFVAIGFTEGKGEVLHFISHMELQRTHLRTKEDEAGLEAFLEKIGATKTADMEEAKVAELEAAYSTLNTLACLCVPMPILSSDLKSSMVAGSKGASKSIKSKRLAP
ncbi:hypothetical protein HYS48_04210 [Candidatus Woesearchaeota archaeon]|nr:hypothetical protein [Candidatus Woesearchaeota archaeon]